MCGRISGIPENHYNASPADVTQYPQRFGLVSYYYSYGPSADDDLRRVIEGQNSTADPVTEGLFASAIRWLLRDGSLVSKFLDWFITL